MTNKNVNLAGTFLEIARQHAARLNTVTIRKYCGVCYADKVMPLVETVGNTERYECPDCHVIYVFAVR